MTLGLNFLSRLYAGALACDRRWRKRTRLPAPVISVGNIAVGGRGKTPLTIWLAQWLKDRNWHPVILTRGYGRHSRENIQLQASDLASESFVGEWAQRCGDEALEMAVLSGCPVLIGARRSAQALAYWKTLKSHERILFLLDDGFQHWSLERDLDIVLVHPQDYSDHLLPLGRLRETPQALERARCVWEYERDYLKKTFFLAPPPQSEPLLALTTRAPDPEYHKILSRDFTALEWLQLPDHSSREKILPLLEKRPEPRLIVGMKEAVKLLPAPELQTFAKQGKAPLILTSGRKVHLHWARCELQGAFIEKWEEVWNEMARTFT